MGKRWVCFLWTMAMAFALIPKAEAAEGMGTVRIIPQCCGSPVAGGTVSLRHVGTVSEDGCYLTDGLANWSVDREELNSGRWDGWILRQDTEHALVRQIDGRSGAVFADLETGIYLVQQPQADCQYQPFKPFFVTVPEGESWDVCRSPRVVRNGESPRTGDHPAPIIGAMGIGMSVALLMVLADKFNR